MMPSRDSLPTLLHLSGLSDFDRERTTFWRASPRQPSLRHVSKSLHQSISHSHSPAHPPLTAAGSGTPCIWRPERVRWVACFCPGVWSQRGSLLPLPSVRAGMTLASSPPLWRHADTPQPTNICLPPLTQPSARERILPPPPEAPFSPGALFVSLPSRAPERGNDIPLRSSQTPISPRTAPASPRPAREQLFSSFCSQALLSSPATPACAAPLRAPQPGNDVCPRSSQASQPGSGTRLLTHASARERHPPPLQSGTDPPANGTRLRPHTSRSALLRHFSSLELGAPQPAGDFFLHPLTRPSAQERRPPPPPTLHPARKRYFSLLQPDAPQPIRDIFIHLLTRPSARERHPSTPPLHPPTAVGDDPSHLPTQCRPAPPPPSLQAQRVWSSSPYFSPVGFFLAPISSTQLLLINSSQRLLKSLHLQGKPFLTQKYSPPPRSGHNSARVAPSGISMQLRSGRSCASCHLSVARQKCSKVHFISQKMLRR